MSNTKDEMPEVEKMLNDEKVKHRVDFVIHAETIAALKARATAEHEAVMEHMMSAVLDNINDAIKGTVDMLYATDQTEVADVTQRDTLMAQLFRGLDGGVDYKELRAFRSWLNGGIAKRRVSGVAGTGEV